MVHVLLRSFWKIIILTSSFFRFQIQFKDAAFLCLGVKIDMSLGKAYPPDLQVQIQTMDNLELRRSGLNSAKDVLQYPVPTGGSGKDPHIRDGMQGWDRR